MMLSKSWFRGTLLLGLVFGAQAAEAPGGEALGTADYDVRVPTRSLAYYPEFPPLPADAEPAEYAGIIATHNVWRREVGAPELTGWSPQAAKMAQSWAEQLSQEGCQMRHNLAPERKKVFGENIYRYWRSSAYEGYKRSPPYIVDAWASEKPWYDALNNSCSPPAEGGTCGHYTQLVWAGSQLVGCGRAHCGDAEVWVCNYYPRGNYIGLRPYPLMAQSAPDAPASVPTPPAPPPAKDDFFGPVPEQPNWDETLR